MSFADTLTTDPRIKAFFSRGCKTAPPPEGATVEWLEGTLPIKRDWIKSELSPHSHSPPLLRFRFPNGLPEATHLTREQAGSVERCFYESRGQGSLWGETRERGDWIKVESTNFPLSWFQEHVVVLYPKTDDFPLPDKLIPIVLWKSPKDDKYLLIDGNHRVSCWLRARAPATIHATVYIGQAPSNPDFPVVEIPREERVFRSGL